MGFKQWLTPPVFADEEKTRAARLLHIILVAATALTVLLAVIVLPALLIIPHSLPSLIMLALLGLPTVLAWFFLHRGSVRLAGLLFISALWLTIMGAIPFSGGMNSSGFTGIIVTILITGLLLGGRSAIGLAVLSVLVTGGLLYVQIRWNWPGVSMPSTPVAVWASHIVNLIMAAVLLHIAMLSLQDALERARRNERAHLEANRELSALSASLEQRVGERTLELQASHADLQQAYEALQANQAKLVVSEKMASLGRLTAGIAHEMNTPLAAVRGALAGLTQLAKEYESSIAELSVTPDDHREITREMQQVIQLAEKATERAADFVQSIKSQTRSLGAPEAEYFDAVSVIQDALVLLGYTLRHAQCVESFEAGAKRVELYGSPGRLTYVITNLVTNAIEASAAKGGGPIDLSLMPGPAGVELKISDQGQGIAPEVLPKIFDPMFTTKPFGEGTGLGLTIVHDIVTSEFGGTIDVESQVGVGTTFIIWFPNRVEVSET